MNKGEGRASRRRRGPARVRLEALETRQLLAAFSVTNVADAGPGSLRQAILDNDNTPGANSITFNIPGPGVHTISPTSPFPAISNPATIDARTQPGYSGTPLVELNGSNIFQAGVTPPSLIPMVSGLTLSGGSSTVEGLAINRFTGIGITATRDGNTIAADFIGTDPTGTTSLGNGGGIALVSRNNMIGGLDAASRNLISGNTGAGISLNAPGAQPSNNVVEGNFIGTDLTGARDLGNAGPGVDVESSNNVIGGVVASLGNTIAFNGGAGVQVGSNPFQSGVNQNRIAGNSIFGNVGIGIDLGNDGVTFNHFNGANFGPNLLQNYPILTSAYSNNGGTQVEGTLNAAPNSSYTVDFYSNPSTDTTGHGLGRTPIGSSTITTDAQGNFAFTAPLAAAVPPGQFVTATATDSAGNTSEFAGSQVVTPTAQADLALIANDPNPTAQAGVAQTYSFTVQNTGPSRATNVVFTDTLPQGATFLSGTSSVGTLVQSNGVVVASLSRLDSGSAATITLTYSVPNPGSATNQASVKADQSDPLASNNAIAQNFQVTPAPPADLSVFGSAAPDPVPVGSDLTYTFAVANNSGNQATGVVFTDTLPSGVVFKSVESSQGVAIGVGGVVTANLGTIPGGSVASVTIVVTTSSAGSLMNTATVRANEPDPNALNNRTTVTTLVTPIPAVDVVVNVVGAPQPATVGLPFTYAVLVGDASPTAATGVTLVDRLPDGVSLDSIVPSQGTYTLAGNLLTVRLGTITPFALTEVTISLTPGAPGSIVDSASVTADQPDFDVSNNFSTQTTLVQGDVVAPIIVDQKLTVSQNQISGVVLTFNKGLDPTSASNVANYQILDLGNRGSLSAVGPRVQIASATYNPTTRSVTLAPARGLSVGRFYKVVVNGPGAPGLVDSAGNVLDGERNGLQNGIYQSLIGRGTKSRPIPLQVGVPGPKPARHHR